MVPPCPAQTSVTLSGPILDLSLGPEGSCTSSGADADPCFLLGTSTC